MPGSLQDLRLLPAVPPLLPRRLARGGQGCRLLPGMGTEAPWQLDSREDPLRTPPAPSPNLGLRTWGAAEGTVKMAGPLRSLLPRGPAALCCTVPGLGSRRSINVCKRTEISRPSRGNFLAKMILDPEGWRHPVLSRLPYQLQVSLWLPTTQLLFGLWVALGCWGELLQAEKWMGGRGSCGPIHLLLTSAGPFGLVTLPGYPSMLTCEAGAPPSSRDGG